MSAVEGQRLSMLGRLWGWARFSVFYLMEVVKSNLYILWDVLTPNDSATPGILALELPDGMSDFQKLLVSNLITMTPGTLSLELSEDGKVLLMHILYLRDVEATRKYLLESYVYRVFHLS